MAEVEQARRAPPIQPRHPPGSERQPCVSCGDPNVGRYCPSCGEKRMTHEDLSLRRFAGEAIHTFTNLESSVFRTFGALLARPGHLTAEYLAGRRRRYIRPLQLFIICNLLFFLLQPYLQIDMLSPQLQVHFQNPYRGLAWNLAQDRIEARGISMLQYAEEFDRVVAVHARSLVIVMVPIFALLVHALHGRARRYFVEHLVFSLHFYAYFLLFFIGYVAILLALLHLLIYAGVASAALWVGENFEGLTVMITLICLTWYLASASRRVYAGSRLINVLKGAILAGSLIPVLALYRMILFFTTFYTT